MRPHLIMPMSGAGSRFYKNGYMQPKPLIEINGKPFLYWATMSIVKMVEVQDITFVVLRDHIDNFGITDVIEKYFPEARIVIIEEVLPGPVFTALHGVENILDDAPIIFNDCDHMFSCRGFANELEKSHMDMDGALLTFVSDEPQFSYVKYDEDHNIVGTIEKEVVSDHAICGAYVFKNASFFKEVATRYISECPYNECFMSGIYNIMCADKKVVRDYLVDFHLEFGTPEEYEKAKDSKYFELL